jgi:hypothetical protein
MSPGMHGAIPAAADALAVGCGPAPVFDPEGAVVGFADALAAGFGVAPADGLGDGTGHALPYAADGSASCDWSAAMDARAAAGTPADGPEWRPGNSQASNASNARPPARMKNLRRQ